MLIRSALGYNQVTSQLASPTTSSDLSDVPISGPVAELLRDPEADRDVWELLRWPSARPSFEELHWLAGLFEGEGSFGASEICITQKDRHVLDMVKRMVGGRVGGPYASVGRQSGKRYEWFRWYATGPRGRGVARTLYQLLSPRRQAQARAFLRISRGQEPPKLDPIEPARMLWDWAAGDDLEALE